MASARLQKHFMRLWQSCEGQAQNTTLEALANQLNCSRRHMRTLLSAMQQAGWINWQAEAGRGKRSTLTFINTGLALQQQRTETLLEQENIDRLIDIVGDKNTLRQMLTAHLGRRFRAGKHILRVLYYRPLLNLLPSTALRRSETHIARQIFSGLTAVNEENGEIKADIAHHWQQLSTRHWRFFIRPGIRFHHGRELEVEDIIASLSDIQLLPLFSNLDKICSPTPWTLDLHLHEEDKYLPWLLSSVHAMILPKEWRAIKQFSRKPIGTGPYSVASNNDTQLKIKSFDDYFGFRALIDEVNFWVIPESEDQSSQLSLQGMPDSEKSVASRLEEGCYYLLFDSRSALGACAEVREWVSHVLTPINILARVATSHQQYWFPAYGMLPRWHHSQFSDMPAKPKGLQRLILTRHHAHTEHRLVSKIMAQLLAEQGVTLEERQVSYSAWHQGEAVSDLWLNSVNFTLPLDYSLFALLYEIPLLQKCVAIDWQQDAQAWRQQRLSLPDWCQKRVENHDILPLIHHWLRIEGQRSMRGIKMNTSGWFDFKSAWFAPP